MTTVLPSSVEAKSYIEIEKRLDKRKDAKGDWHRSHEYPPDFSTINYPASEVTWRHFCAMLNSADPDYSYRLVRVRDVRQIEREVI